MHPGQHDNYNRTVQTTAALRNKLAADTQAFLAAGGVITTIDTGHTSDNKPVTSSRAPLTQGCKNALRWLAGEVSQVPHVTSLRALVNRGLARRHQGNWQITRLGEHILERYS